MVNLNFLPKFPIILVKWSTFILVSLIIIILLHEKDKAILVAKQQKIILLKKEIQAIDTDISNASQKKLTFGISSGKHAHSLFYLLKKLPNTIPIGLYLTELSMIKNSVKLSGYAQSAELISTWIAKLNAAHFTAQVREIMRNKEVDGFEIKFCLWVRF